MKIINRFSESYRLFQFMWCVFILIHHSVSVSSWVIIGDGWLQSTNEFVRVCAILTAVFALLGAIRTDKPYLLLVTVVFWSILKFTNLPYVPNHIILALLINACVIISIILVPKKQDTYLIDLYNYIAPPLRMMLIVVYFFTVFHKLNIDFFDPNVSCGVLLYKEIAQSISFLPVNSLMMWVSTIGIIFIECLIPILLFFSRGRLLGVMLGLIFHYILSLNPNPYISSFSAEMYALLTLFLSGNYAEKIVSLGRKFKHNYIKLTLWIQLLAPVILVLIFYLIGSDKLNLEASFFSIVKQIAENYAETLSVAWNVWSVFIIVSAFYIWRTHTVTNEKGIQFLRPSHLVLVLFPFLLIINGMTPYIGLKTATNFSMFSNLRADGEINNHFFMSSEFQLGGYQTDRIEILETDIEYFQQMIDRGETTTHLDFVRRLQNMGIKPGNKLHYLRNGEYCSVLLPSQWTRIRNDGYSWIENKLLVFRNVPAKGPCPCQW